MKTLTITTLLCLLVLGSVFLSACGTKDYLSLRHAKEAKDTVEKYLDPALPESARKAALEQAAEWVKYEEGK